MSSEPSALEDEDVTIYNETETEEKADEPDVVGDSDNGSGNEEINETDDRVSQEQTSDDEVDSTEPDASIEPEGNVSGNAEQVNAIQVQATYYTSYCDGCIGITASGHDVSGTIYAEGHRVIAVDPSVIPLGSIVEVSTPYNTFTAIASDTGSAINGNIIDILVDSKGEARDKGRVSAEVRILE